MGWKHRGGQVTVLPPNTKHRVEYWVDRERNKVVYVWFNAVGSTARIVNWDYSGRLEQEDTALNKLRDVINRDRKVRSYASIGVGRVEKKFDAADLSNNKRPFDVALNEAINMYNLPYNKR